ncbi:MULTISPECIES: Rossmann-like and DUF2520 domain-containing protein [unclassified Sphingobacterium]|uniref:Rossmann-like and DUF2520 domain-containing protein n=1 Tax=unclassified Sphingobacterium TaxID=2609468 RepID=UPI0020C4FE80|nr:MULTISPECIES: Rossmann-like and DUF2520 domain-containing protein [unclassified Sphingobacterium]
MNIVLIGSGNIATHLGKAFTDAGHHVAQVYSRTLANANALANVLSAQAIDNLAQLDPNADLYLLAVSDSAIAELAQNLPNDLEGTIAHCSGATDVEVLKDFKNHGVIYPVQSFSKHKELDLNHTPFGIEGNNEKSEQVLLQLAREISDNTFACNSQQRLALHVSAVFANNFSNALFQLSFDLLKEHNLPFDLIRPIIQATAEKVQNHEPRQVQTGPAARNDKTTMVTHFNFLSPHPDWQLIYQKISDLIIKTRENNSEN